MAEPAFSMNMTTNPRRKTRHADGNDTAKAQPSTRPSVVAIAKNVDCIACRPNDARPALGIGSDVQSSDSHAHSPLRLIRLSDVMRQTGLRRTSIYARIKEGTFPLAVKLGTSSRWVEEEVSEWIRGLVQARNDIARKRPS